MQEQEVQSYAVREDNTEMNVGSPLQHSQKMLTQDDEYEQDISSMSKEKADLPKSIVKPKQVVITTNGADVEYVPENPEFDFETLKTSSNFIAKQYPEATFLGERVNGKRHGLGVMKYNSNRVYEGEWVDDIR